jgi:hypothetical protein
MSTLLECFLTFSGRHLVVPRLDRAALSIINFIPGRYVCSRASGQVAFYAFSLVIFLSLFSSYTGVHITVTTLPSFCSCLMEL